MLALILMCILPVFLVSVWGLFSPVPDGALERSQVVDPLHLWVPMVVIGTSGTAGLIRVLRNTLNELGKTLCGAARSKVGTLAHVQVPRVDCPDTFISTVGWRPQMISGSGTATVLSLPTAALPLWVPPQSGYVPS